jgi:heme-degrading monooxygenase HmoA
MSVLVITKIRADVAMFEKIAADNTDTLRSISAEGRSRGAESHLFADDGEGNMLIVDVWDTREHFDEFFGSQPEIARLMQEAGVTAPPSTVSYEVVDSSDRF